MIPCKASGLSIWWGMIMTRVPHAGHAILLEPVVVFCLQGRMLLRLTLPTIVGFPSEASHDGRPSITVPQLREPYARRPSHAPASPGSCQGQYGLARLWGQADNCRGHGCAAAPWHRRVVPEQTHDGKDKARVCVLGRPVGGLYCLPITTRAGLRDRDYDTG